MKVRGIFVIILFFVLTAFINDKSEIKFTKAELDYIKSIGRVTMCVDPDWYPFESVDKDGKFSGIAADLIDLVSQRTGIKFELVKTKDWNESLEYSKAGKCRMISFLNQTPERLKWLIFTEPIFNDLSVIITREEHHFIASPVEMSGQTVVVPTGDAVEERLRHDHPKIMVINTETEEEAFDLVVNKKADMTIRSLIMSAYTIRKKGMFNLKIAGQLPEYTNYLRLGLLKNETILRDILNKAIATISDEEKAQIVNKHVYITIETPIDYWLIIRIASVIVVLGIIMIYWNYRLKKINEERNILLDNIPVQVWYMSDDHTYGAVNKAHASFHGARANELAYKDMFKVLPKEIAEAHNKRIREVLSTGKSIYLEDWEMDYTGSERLLSITKSPKLRSNGTVEYVICFARDITEQKKAEELLKHNEERFRVIFENAPIGIFRFDKDGIINSCNDNFVKIIGSSRALLIGLNMMKLPDIRIVEALSVCLSGNSTVFEGDYHSTTADKLTPVRLLFQPQFTADNSIDGGIGIVEDISERKFNEIKIHNYMEELEKLNQELSISKSIIEESLYEKNQLVEKLELINSEKDKFFTIIAHDLRNPFQSFIGLTDLMANDVDSLTIKEVSSLSESLNKQAKNLFELLKNLLEWAKMQQGTIAFEPSPYDLTRLIDQNIERVKLNAASKEISISKKVKENFVVYVDENMINSVIMNLLTNAIKFTPRNGEVAICTEKEGNEFVKVSIIDNGIGMEKELVEKLFRIDQKVSRVGTEGEASSGLGLLLCKDFIQKHYGDICVESQPCKGSTFSFTLPIYYSS